MLDRFSSSDYFYYFMHLINNPFNHTPHINNSEKDCNQASLETTYNCNIICTNILQIFYGFSVHMYLLVQNSVKAHMVTCGDYFYQVHDYGRRNVSVYVLFLFQTIFKDVQDDKTPVTADDTEYHYLNRKHCFHGSERILKFLSRRRWRDQQRRVLTHPCSRNAQVRVQGKAWM